MIRIGRRSAARFAGAAIVTSVAAFAAVRAAAGGEPAKDLKDPDVSVRLSAVDALKSSRAADAESLLASALDDKDGEVAERAAAALGFKGGDVAVAELAKACTDAGSRRIRLSAGRALSSHPRWAEGAALLAKAQAKELLAACDAAVAFASEHEDENIQRLSERGLAAKKEPAIQAAAARLVTAWPEAERAKRLAALAHHENSACGSAAMDAVRAKPSPATTAVILELLGKTKPTMTECTERRARAAWVASVQTSTAPVTASGKPEEDASALGIAIAKAAKPLFDALAAAESADAAIRYVRAIGDLAEVPGKRPDSALTTAALGPALGHKDPRARSAAAWALGKLGGDPAADGAVSLAKDDGDAHVRLIALRSAVAIRPTDKHDLTFRLVCDRLANDPDPMVREEAAVALGRPGLQGAIGVLGKAVDRAVDAKDSAEWALGTCALVSLGKTRDPAAVPVLAATLQRAKDWRLRASAVVGLGHVRDRSAVPHLIDALTTKDPITKNCAYEFLRRMTSEKVDAKAADWKAWWEKNGAEYRWPDREGEARKAQKYGYAPDLKGVYEGLDVIVLATRGGGDRIEDVLEDLKIEHRLTRAGSVMDAGLHPFALFVANCPGELTNKDVEPLQWYVRCGGHLFNSCWALHETIEKIYPGVLRKYQIPHQVIDNVTAESTKPTSPFVEGVFKDLVEPIYCLEGAHLIDVMDHDRAEVLMDSPWTEQKYGSGNMVAWFDAGHGLVLDSCNHFEEQGVAKAAVKTPEERIAYAADHMGMTWAEIRKVDPKAWKSPQDAGRAAKDLSCFRLITNFVRLKRKSQE